MNLPDAALAVQTLGAAGPAERWQAGDVVRNADVIDKTAWSWEQDHDRDELCWRLVGYHAMDRKEFPTQEYWRRDELPPRLALVLRDGQSVPPEPTDDIVAEVAAATRFSREGARGFLDTIDRMRGLRP